jgi:hypothetical protein
MLLQESIGIGEQDGRAGMVVGRWTNACGERLRRMSSGLTYSQSSFIKDQILSVMFDYSRIKNIFCLLPQTTTYGLVLCVLLSIIVCIEWSCDFSWVSNSSFVGPMSSVPKSKSKPLKLQPLSRDLVRTIAARPVFASSRRPYVPPQTDEPPDEVNMKLMCVLTTESERVALIKLEVQERLVRVREQDFISDWQVENISAEHISLRRNGNVRILRLWPTSSG